MSKKNLTILTIFSIISFNIWGAELKPFECISDENPKYLAWKNRLSKSSEFDMKIFIEYEKRTDFINGYNKRVTYLKSQIDEGYARGLSREVDSFKKACDELIEKYSSYIPSKTQNPHIYSFSNSVNTLRGVTQKAVNKLSDRPCFEYFSKENKEEYIKCNDMLEKAKKYEGLFKLNAINIEHCYAKNRKSMTDAMKCIYGLQQEYALRLQNGDNLEVDQCVQGCVASCAFQAVNGDRGKNHSTYYGGAFIYPSEVTEAGRTYLKNIINFSYGGLGANPLALEIPEAVGK